MNSKIGVLFISVIVAAVLWLLGGFVLGNSLGMICVMVGIAIVGLAAGNVMNSPCLTSEEK